MSVQYKAVSSNPPLHIVLYCVTPPEFRRYSSLTLCPPCPAWGECVEQNGSAEDRERHPSREGNLPGKPRCGRRQLGPNDWQLAVDRRSLDRRSSRCSN